MDCIYPRIDNFLEQRKAEVILSNAQPLVCSGAAIRITTKRGPHIKIFFISVLVLNLLLEGLAAFSLIAGPQGIFAEVQPESGMWAMNYGFAALAIASAVFWIWPYRDNRQAVGSVLGILLTFHTFMFISLAIPGNQMPGMIAHAVMAVLCLVVYTQRSKWCDE